MMPKATLLNVRGLRTSMYQDQTILYLIGKAVRSTVLITNVDFEAIGVNFGNAHQLAAHQCY